MGFRDPKQQKESIGGCAHCSTGCVLMIRRVEWWRRHCRRSRIPRLIMFGVAYPTLKVLLVMAAGYSLLGASQNPVVAVSWPVLIDQVMGSSDWSPQSKATLMDTVSRNPEVISQYQDKLLRGDPGEWERALEVLKRSTWGFYEIADEVLLSRNVELMRRFAASVDIDINLADAMPRSFWSGLDQQQVKPRLEDLLRRRNQGDPAAAYRASVMARIAAQSHEESPRAPEEEILVEFMDFEAHVSSEEFASVAIEWLSNAPIATKTQRRVVAGVLLLTSRHIGPVRKWNLSDLGDIDQSRDELVRWWTEAKSRRQTNWLLDRLTRAGIAVSRPEGVTSTVDALIAALRSPDPSVANAAARVVTLVSGGNCTVTMPQPGGRSPQEESSVFGTKSLYELLGAIAVAKAMAYFAPGNWRWDAQTEQYVRAEVESR